jgi:hypothetical protein
MLPQGVIVSGDSNKFIEVSPRSVGSVYGEAMGVFSDHNQIIGGFFNGTGNKTIRFNAGADNNRVIGARVIKAIINNGANNKFSKVDGYVTESSGTATIPSGSTSVTVNHGLGVTPSVKDCSVTPTNSLGSATKFWTSNFTATTFTINVNADLGATTATFAWSCQVL